MTGVIAEAVATAGVSNRRRPLGVAFVVLPVCSRPKNIRARRVGAEDGLGLLLPAHVRRRRRIIVNGSPWPERPVP